MTKLRNRSAPAAGGLPAARERILNAAMSAFMERGYAGSSTLDIATCARVSKRELYAHFGDKQAMLAACVLERAKRMRLPFESPPARDLNGLALILRRFGEAVLREVTRPEVTSLFRLAVAEAERSPDIAHQLNAVGRNANRAALTRLLAQAKTHRLIDGDPSAVSRQFLSLLWDDLQVQLLLRLAKPPAQMEIARRARDATETLLSLHGSRESSGDRP